MPRDAAPATVPVPVPASASTPDAEISDQRIGEILDRIRASFVTKGFDGASMQELARSAGMSAGNFYRYFPSKTAIIGALIARDLHTVLEEFRVVNGAAEPLRSLRALVSRRVAMPAEDSDARLWAEIEAVASRDSGLGEVCLGMQVAINDQIVATFARIAGRSPEFIRARQQHSADALMILVKGAAIRACRPAPTRPSGAADPAADPAALHALVMRMFDTILADIADLARAGGGEAAEALPARPRLCAVEG